MDNKIKDFLKYMIILAVAGAITLLGMYSILKYIHGNLTSLETFLWFVLGYGLAIRPIVDYWYRIIAKLFSYKDDNNLDDSN